MQIKSSYATLMFFLALATILTATLSPLIIIINIVRYMTLKTSTLKNYLYNILVSIDQFAGTILYNQLDFTISSYTFYLCEIKKRKEACIFRKFINTLFGAGHCERSFYGEIQDYNKILKDIK